MATAKPQSILLNERRTANYPFFPAFLAKNRSRACASDGRRYNQKKHFITCALLFFSCCCGRCSSCRVSGRWRWRWRWRCSEISVHFFEIKRVRRRFGWVDTGCSHFDRDFKQIIVALTHRFSFLPRLTPHIHAVPSHQHSICMRIRRECFNQPTGQILLLRRVFNDWYNQRIKIFLLFIIYHSYITRHRISSRERQHQTHRHDRSSDRAIDRATEVAWYGTGTYEVCFSRSDANSFYHFLMRNSKLATKQQSTHHCMLRVSVNHCTRCAVFICSIKQWRALRFCEFFVRRRRRQNGRTLTPCHNRRQQTAGSNKRETKTKSANDEANAWVDRRRAMGTGRTRREAGGGAERAVKCVLILSIVFASATTDRRMRQSESGQSERGRAVGVLTSTFITNKSSDFIRSF